MKRVLVALVAYALTSIATPETLKYEPAIVGLIGELQSGEGVDPDGKPVRYPALKLDAPVRVVADPGDKLNETEEQVSLLQLVLSPPLMAEYVKMKGQNVFVTGTLMHAHTGHHYTAVLMQAQQLDPVAAPNKPYMDSSRK